MTTAELVLTNARIVAEAAIVAGTLTVAAGRIAEIAPGPTRATGAIDLEGDWLLPGLVELHTDNLERQFQPRPGVRWPGAAAMLQHDAQIVAAGITTVCDAVCVGFYGGNRERLDFLRLSLDCRRRAAAAGALKAEHLVHLRLEVSDPHCVELFEPLLASERDLAVVSFMDHTPGQRQWHDLDRFRTFHLGRTVKTETEFQALVERRVAEQRHHAVQNRAALLRLLDGHPAVRASHDDTTVAHVDEAKEAGCAISEFPTTLEAARAARAAGLAVVMGAPNLILGGSHSGNVAAEQLLDEDLLDVWSSDYVPASLLQAVFLAVERHGRPLPHALAPVTSTPARLLGLADRGSLAPGKRADLVRVRVVDGVPAVAAVWRAGARIA
jgi:alpha-D-ribose 1-methylphosphonate 5-triphosphate diphosphatase